MNKRVFASFLFHVIVLNVSRGQDGYQSQPSALQCDAYKGQEVCQTDFYEFFATFFEKYTTG